MDSGLLIMNGSSFSEDSRDIGPISRMFPSVFIYKKEKNPEFFIHIRFRDGHEVLESSHSTIRSDANIRALELIARRYGDSFIREANLELWQHRLETEYGATFEFLHVDFSEDGTRVIAQARRRDTGEIRQLSVWCEPTGASD